MTENTPNDEFPVDFYPEVDLKIETLSRVTRGKFDLRNGSVLVSGVRVGFVESGTILYELEEKRNAQEETGPSEWKLVSVSVKMKMDLEVDSNALTTEAHLGQLSEFDVEGQIAGMRRKIVRCRCDVPLYGVEPRDGILLHEEAEFEATDIVPQP